MRRAALPLYLKILGWFFLNLLLLAAVFGLWFQAQFRLNLDWLLAAGAGERIGAVRDLIVEELNVRPTDEWSQVLDRFSDAYRVRFSLFDEDAAPLLGPARELPAEVRQRALAQMRGETVSAAGTKSGKSSRARSSTDGETDAVQVLMRTAAPTRYWLVTGARIDNPQTGEPLRTLLVATSGSLSGGGLILNPRPWLEVGAGAVVFSLLFWLPLVRGITRSLGQMTHATRRIADGSFDVRLNTRRRDELGSLAESINQMAERLDGFVAGQKRFLGDIAHELCSPLARLQLALGILDQRATEDQAPFVRSAAEKAEQMSALVGELLSFSKASFGAPAVQLQAVSACEAADEAVRREWVEGIDFPVEIPSDLFVAADHDLLVRALSNLVRNAIRHAGKAGPITLRGSQADGEATLSVADCGPGVPEGELTKIFEPFYRADASRTRETGNAGLGLTIVKACVQSCGGTVSAHNRQPRGLEVRMQLAAARTTAVVIRPASSAETR